MRATVKEVKIRAKVILEDRLWYVKFFVQNKSQCAEMILNKIVKPSNKSEKACFKGPKLILYEILKLRA